MLGYPIGKVRLYRCAEPGRLRGAWRLGPQDTLLCWQEATRCLSKSKDLMEAVLRDPGLLALQREGGATLARLQQEASRLNTNPEVRYRQSPVLPSPSELRGGATL